MLLAVVISFDFAEAVADEGVMFDLNNTTNTGTAGKSEVTFNVGSDDYVVDIVACATASAANFVAAGEGVAVVVAITANIIFVFVVTFNAVVTAAAVEGIAAVVSLFKFNQLMQDSAASRDICFFHT